MLLSFDQFNIQPVHEKDYWNLCNFAVANEDRLRAFFPLTLAQNLTPELSKFFAEKKAKQFQEKTEFLYTIKEKEKKGLVGLVYIKELDWTIQQGEFAYCIGYEYEGKGIISTSIKQLTQHAFENLGLKTLQIIAHESNLASIKVAEKNDFIWKKTLLKSYTPPNGEPMDMELYELSI
ncbi:GNAT family N-acetyltransferase [Winogradskyella sp. 3972H.M.0a.05]|uniref:GNAT family N-acetyltransferase n=1 Tax=Winogradskyella sp. 3972H.M.0a.05 TaxID=2950277 RepID=UPI0033938916